MVISRFTGIYQSDVITPSPRSQHFIHENIGFHGQNMQNEHLIHKKGPFHGQRTQNLNTVHKKSRFYGQNRSSSNHSAHQGL